MPFCCIAIVAIAMMYFTFLSLRQLFLYPRRDKRASSLPAPPRALTGMRSQPVYGHTRLFTRCGGDMAHSFPPDMREWRWLPQSWSRKLGECFSIFIWGQWRVVVKGPERARLVFEQPDLREGWAWTPPVTLLGRSCLPLKEKEDPEEAEFLRNLLSGPMGQRNIVRYAPDFADIAEQFVDDLIAGKFKRKKTDDSNPGDDNFDFASDDEFDRMEEGQNNEKSNSADQDKQQHKIKWNALRSYTFDLIDGPVLRMNKWTQQSEQGTGERSSQLARETIPEEQESTKKTKKKKKDPDRSTMLLWMERLKAAMCVIKMTFGAEWMYIWLFNEYGRAVNGRMHIERVISAHVAERSKQLPVQRDPGLMTRDPALTSFPWITMAENVLRRHENVLGDHNKRAYAAARPRSHSAPDISEALEPDDNEITGPLAQSVPSPPLEPPPSPKAARQRSDSSPVVLQTTRKHMTNNETPVRRPPHSILDSIMRQHDGEGKGMTQAAVTELSVLLWMIMDAGNAWTAMALQLLSMDQSACDVVQQELDALVLRHGNDHNVLYSPRVLAEMRTLDALLWEAIRLCPPFLGGMKVVSHTIEFPEDGVQIPKNTNVIFCQPTDGAFNLTAALGKKPEYLGFNYPCVEVHGFMPFQGLELPIMVLQSKVFLAVLLQRCSPFVSKKRTFIRRVKAAISRSSSRPDMVDMVPNEENDVPPSSNSSRSPDGRLTDRSDDIGNTTCCGMTQAEAMRVFTKIPFPEPRRVLNFTERAEL